MSSFTVLFTSLGLAEKIYRKGIADELLAKKEEERGRTKERGSPSPPHPSSQSRKRVRSVSSSASDSVATISTNLSVSPKRPRRELEGYMTSQRETLNFRSPSIERKRRYRSHSSVSYSSSDRSFPLRDRGSQHRRRRHRTVSPESRGRPSSQRRGSRRSRSRSESIDKSRVARGRKSMTPHLLDGERRRSDHGNMKKESRWPDHDADPGRSAGNGSVRQPDSSHTVRKERSLSPYSRRLALTQSMNMVR